VRAGRDQDAANRRQRQHANRAAGARKQWRRGVSERANRAAIGFPDLDAIGAGIGNIRPPVGIPVRRVGEEQPADSSALPAECLEKITGRREDQHTMGQIVCHVDAAVRMTANAGRTLERSDPSHPGARDQLEHVIGGRVTPRHEHARRARATGPDRSRGPGRT
jgi:hypothetical protein